MSDDAESTSTSASALPQLHPLSDKWCIWAHLPQDADWSLESYHPIMTVDTVEMATALMNKIPPNIIEKCMLFIMRQGIKPTWEDIRNRNGGSFSYKIGESHVNAVWRNLYAVLLGGTISKANAAFTRDVTGITISPKKNFCIVKIWMTNCAHQDPSVVNPECCLPLAGCIFKKHAPEY